MFGFTGSPCRSCSSQETHSAYRSFFCGLSGALARDYSPTARFLANRDSTFLSILGAAASGQKPEMVMSTCCNPIAIPRPLFRDDLHAQYAAAVTICGLSTKLADDSHDERGLRKNASRILGTAISGFTDRAVSLLNTLNFPTATVQDMIREQEVIEQRKPDLLEAAAPTSNAYGLIFQHAARLHKRAADATSYQSIGQELGRLIYWRDAYDDRSEDEKRGRFNPLTHSNESEFTRIFTHSFRQFLNIANTMPGALHEVIRPVLEITYTRHNKLVMMNSPEDREQWEKKTRKQIRTEERKKARRSRKKNRCWDHCCDPCCDCGPGDSGCCDCDCG